MTLLLLFRGAAAVGAETQALWNLGGPTAAEVQALWSVEGAVGAQVQALWDIRMPAGADVRFRWNVDSNWLRLLPEAEYEVTILEGANKVWCIVEGSSPLTVGSATNTTVPPTYATSPREMVVTIKDGDGNKCNTVAAAHLALRQVERYRLNNLPVPLRHGLLIRRGQKVTVRLPRAGILATLPVRRVEHDFASNVTKIDVGEFAAARDDAGAVVDVAKALAQLEKEVAI